MEAPSSIHFKDCGSMSFGTARYLFRLYTIFKIFYCNNLQDGSLIAFMSLSNVLNIVHLLSSFTLANTTFSNISLLLNRLFMYHFFNIFKIHYSSYYFANFFFECFFLSMFYFFRMYTVAFL